MTETRRSRIIDRLREVRDEIPEAIALSVLTAIATLALLIIVSSVLGASNEQHRIATRCFANQTTRLIREIVLSSDILRERIDLAHYPLIDVTGLDCATVFEHTDGVGE
jgi:hypothetical protein